MPANEAFLDTSYAIALAAPADQYHQRAVALSAQLQAGQTRLITTRAVVLEMGNALAKQRHRDAAITLLEALARDPNIEVVPLSEVLYQQAFNLYRQRQDKDWGLMDCASFVVMQQRGLTDALTADDHFRQAGFRALLKEG
jgi:predicted nucleic acid-binding protein